MAPGTKTRINLILGKIKLSNKKINIILKPKLKDTTDLKLDDNSIMMKNIDDFKLNEQMFKKGRHFAVRKRRGMMECDEFEFEGKSFK